MKWISLCLLIFPLLGCATEPSNVSNTLEKTLTVPDSSSDLLVASFNIQFLGNGKKRDNEALASILKSYDLVLVQELVAPPTSGVYPNGKPYKADPEAKAFFDAMSEHGFEYHLSEEDTGTGDTIHKASSATEWWVAFYKPTKLTVSDDLYTGYLAEDRSNHPSYERVPYAFSFEDSTTGFDFTMISVHLQPKSGPSYRQRRKEELESIFQWIKQSEMPERDFYIVGDMNFYSCDVLLDMSIGEFETLNNECLATNTNVKSPQPYDHVLYRKNYSSEVNQEYGFRVVNLIEVMKSFWQEEQPYPGTPYNHNRFRAVYSDHNPIVLKFSSIGDDD